MGNYSFYLLSNNYLKTGVSTIEKFREAIACKKISPALQEIKELRRKPFRSCWLCGVACS